MLKIPFDFIGEARLIFRAPERAPDPNLRIDNVEEFRRIAIANGNQRALEAIENLALQGFDTRANRSRIERREADNYVSLNDIKTAVESTHNNHDPDYIYRIGTERDLDGNSTYVVRKFDRATYEAQQKRIKDWERERRRSVSAAKRFNRLHSRRRGGDGRRARPARRARPKNTLDRLGRVATAQIGVKKTAAEWEAIRQANIARRQKEKDKYNEAVAFMGRKRGNPRYTVPNVHRLKQLENDHSEAANRERDQILYNMEVANYNRRMRSGRANMGDVINRVKRTSYQAQQVDKHRTEENSNRNIEVIKSEGADLKKLYKRIDSFADDLKGSIKFVDILNSNGLGEHIEYTAPNGVIRRIFAYTDRPNDGYDVKALEPTYGEAKRVYRVKDKNGRLVRDYKNDADLISVLQQAQASVAPNSQPPERPQPAPEQTPEKSAKLHERLRKSLVEILREDDPFGSSPEAFIAEYDQMNTEERIAFLAYLETSAIDAEINFIANDDGSHTYKVSGVPQEVVFHQAALQDGSFVEFKEVEALDDSAEAPKPEGDEEDPFRKNDLDSSVVEGIENGQLLTDLLRKLELYNEYVLTIRTDNNPNKVKPDKSYDELIAMRQELRNFVAELSQKITPSSPDLKQALDTASRVLSDNSTSIDLASYNEAAWAHFIEQTANLVNKLSDFIK